MDPISNIPRTVFGTLFLAGFVAGAYLSVMLAIGALSLSVFYAATSGVPGFVWFLVPVAVLLFRRWK